MSAKQSVAEATRHLLAIITAHLDNDDETASAITVGLDHQQMQNLVAVSTVQLAEAWRQIALHEGTHPTVFVRDIALRAAQLEGQS